MKYFMKRKMYIPRMIYEHNNYIVIKEKDHRIFKVDVTYIVSTIARKTKYEKKKNLSIYSLT